MFLSPLLSPHPSEVLIQLGKWVSVQSGKKALISSSKEDVKRGKLMTKMSELICYTEWLTELGKPVYALDYWFIIKG